MPRKKKAGRIKQVYNKTAESKRAVAKAVQPKQNAIPQNKWTESYTGLFLGIIVVVAGILLLSVFKNKQSSKFVSTQSLSTVAVQKHNQKTTLTQNLPKTYEVKTGDYLWSIAEKVYGSGYNWIDIAKVNHLANPGVIYKGEKLIIPDVKPIMLSQVITSAPISKSLMPGVNSTPITSDTYTVMKGDYLWAIAVRAYGNGYKWMDIAKYNHLANPGMIFAGNVLKLPR